MPGNWAPNIVPGPDDEVYIGNLPGAKNSTVYLGAPGTGYKYLEISDGMTLDLAGGELVSFDQAHITGENSQLIVRPAAGPNFHDFQGELLLQPHARFHMVDNVDVRLFGTTIANGTISGRGHILVESYEPFGLGGEIHPDANGGITITQGSMERYPVNLDSFLGGGHLNLETPSSSLTINASALVDSFSGWITMAPGASLAMNLEEPWRADNNSQINIGSSNVPAAVSRILGSDVEFDGTVNVRGDQGHLQVTANASVMENAVVMIGEGDRLEFDGETTLLGGRYVVAEDGLITFDGHTVVNAGHIETFSNFSSDGTVQFNGPTTWKGHLEVEGIARQVGNATVGGITNVQANVFDMDGGGNAEWDINHIATINAESIDSTISNTFDGVLNVNGLFGRLNVQLTGVFDKWTMNGELNLSNPLPNVAVRIDGATMRSSGVINADGKVRIAADVEFAGNSETNFDDASTELWMESHTLVEDGAAFVGDGMLRNRSTGDMVLADGASLDAVGLVNEGLLAIGNSPGIASVDRFENTADATWLVEIGGHLEGVEHDVLQVTAGETLLNGTLEINLVDAGDGLFHPEVGDEFTILTSVGDVVGHFQNNPVSLADGQQFSWEVLYHPHDVTVRLLDIAVPEPAPLGIVAVFLFAAGATRTVRFRELKQA
ncbi:MAG: hypothetical protein R3E01_18380 [Pirellulaceae bacterium]|nr:hypothetical protein [Planctomycetales bacterium]